MKEGIEKLRGSVRLFSNCNETFNQSFTDTELLALYDAYCACGWDITPDRWTDRQVADAIDGIIPKWDENENPVVAKPLARKYATTHQ